jgi:hypothetical protein
MQSVFQDHVLSIFEVLFEQQVVLLVTLRRTSKKIRQIEVNLILCKISEESSETDATTDVQ